MHIFKPYPCVNCKSKEVYIFNDIYHEYYIRCGDCNARTDTDRYIEKVMDEWNTKWQEFLDAKFKSLDSEILELIDWRLSRLEKD